VLDEFRSTVGEMLDRNMRTVLGSFGFSGDAPDRRIVELSGGEQTRLALAMTMARPVNLLILDEPTNHLDLPSCDLLEDALRAYPGTVVLVTHDRHLIRGVADALLEVRDGTARWHEGVDERVLAPGQTITKPVVTREVADVNPKKTDVAKTERRAAAASRNDRHQKTKDLRKRLARVERDWEAAEAAVVMLQEKLADPATYQQHHAIRELTSEHDAAKTLAAELMSEWERLSSRVEQT
jgi:ATP-binding cassette subfamily F protein 3